MQPSVYHTLHGLADQKDVSFQVGANNVTSTVTYQTIQTVTTNGESYDIWGGQGEAVAHLVGQLATKSEVSGVRIPVRAKSILSLFIRVHPPQNGWLGLLRPGKSKGGEECNGKLPHNALCRVKSGPYSWFPRCLD
ncbi:hypothetical protein PoB_000497700 [Plakobranchus ocellatus]|uniref:Uncharacterized protein n=1 Tax=Plakobranchus ocellatus TaxID=259542 RepID=A0AAV3Y8K9_9GAST|nr:hypothetical protein PoB_000497700 [Plakobranchus ocellatus]